MAVALIALCALAITGRRGVAVGQEQTGSTPSPRWTPNSSDIRDPNGQIGDENFLIVGVDSRIGANSRWAPVTTAARGARSDTIMLVNIPASRKRVVAVFPATSRSTPMNCRAWDPETGKYGPVYDETPVSGVTGQRETGTKLNSAYALGGPKCLVKVIQKISGLAINRFMAVDFAGFAKMVDALGGSRSAAPPRWTTPNSAILTTAGRQTSSTAPGAELRARPLDRHRGQRRLRPDQNASSCSCRRCCGR